MPTPFVGVSTAPLDSYERSNELSLDSQLGKGACLVDLDHYHNTVSETEPWANRDPNFAGLSYHESISKLTRQAGLGCCLQSIVLQEL